MNNENAVIGVNAEREFFRDLLRQMKGMHESNRSVVTVLEFLDECVLSRIEREVKNES
jgi:hypothetical protein